MAEDLTLWAVYTNDDLTEGRGRQYVKHFCEIEATANRLAKRGYVMGSDCPVKPVKAIKADGQYFLPTSVIDIVFPSREDVEAQHRADTRKLSIEKAKALGLSDEEISIIAMGAR